MIKKYIAMLGCVAVIGFSFAGCGSEKVKTEEVVTGTNVSVYEVKEGSLESTVSYSGTVLACESVSVSAKATAKAQSVNVTEGDYVNAGTVLCKLDETDIRLSYEQALSGYNSAVAGYNSVVNSSSKQMISQANQSLKSAQTAYEQAKLNYEREKTLYENASTLKLAEQQYNDVKNIYDRTKQLFEMGGASQVELDAAYSNLVSAEENLKTVRASSSAAYENAKIALSNAENALNAAKENVTLTENAVKSSIETASASVESAKAALNIAKNALNNTTITAPISGYIAKCLAVQGQNVMAGTEVFVVKNADMVDVVVNVTESVIPLIHEGSKAVISVSSAGITNVEGSVTNVNPVKNDMTGLYGVKVSIDNSDQKLNVGMLADVTLTTASVDDIIKIPSASLISEGDDYFAYVTNGDKAEKVKITIGITDGEFTEIIDGISVGDKVIVSGKEYLSETNNQINVTGEYEKE